MGREVIRSALCGSSSSICYGNRSPQLYTTWTLHVSTRTICTATLVLIWPALLSHFATVPTSPRLAYTFQIFCSVTLKICLSVLLPTGYQMMAKWWMCTINISMGYGVVTLPLKWRH
jgi:hypothetical protein